MSYVPNTDAITEGSTNKFVTSAEKTKLSNLSGTNTGDQTSIVGIVSPSGTTTYKLRGARGTTTQTGNCIVSDGNGVNTANNVSNNSDKGTSIRAIRIA